jgi:hypothetical protein
MIRSIGSYQKQILYEYISKKNSLVYGSFATDLFCLLNGNGPGGVLDNPTLDYNLTDKLPFAGRFSTKIISVIKKNTTLKIIAYKVYRMLNK